MMATLEETSINTATCAEALVCSGMPRLVSATSVSSGIATAAFIRTFTTADGSQMKTMTGYPETIGGTHLMNNV